MLHISIKAEELFSLYGFSITNSILTSWVVIAFFALIALYFYKNYSVKKNRITFFILFMVSGLYSMFQSILGANTKRFFPILASFFLYILLSNWLGLLPGVGSIVYIHEAKPTASAEVDYAESNGPVTDAQTEEEAHGPARTPILRATTADLNMTIALGLIAFVLIQVSGIQFLGLGYFKKFIDLSNPIAFFTGVLEIISEFSKIISFAFRLFGNIFAGEVLLAVVAFLIPVLASFPFLMLEVFVGFIQALVFAMLVSVFLNMAIAKHH